MARQSFCEMQTTLAAKSMPHLGIHYTYCVSMSKELPRFLNYITTTNELLNTLLINLSLSMSQVNTLQTKLNIWQAEVKEMLDTLKKAMTYSGGYQDLLDQCEAAMAEEPDTVSEEDVRLISL